MHVEPTKGICMNTSEIVVTGAASGIGAQTVEVLRALGATVIGVDRDAPATEDISFVQADLSTPAGVERAVDGIRNLAQGSIHGVANIAGVPGTAPWELVHRVNVFGLRDLTTGLVPLIVPGGSIVNLASAVAYRWRELMPELAQFCAHPSIDDALAMAADAPAIREHSYLFSKQCVRYLTELQAATLVEHRIRVNSVSPGPIETPILDDFKADHGKDKVEGAREALGRFGQPTDVANVVAHLFNDSMSWVNGTDIRVDGGLTALREMAAARVQ